MARGDGRIEPGQRLTSAISAKAWNRAQQAADIVLGSTPGLEAAASSSLSSPYTWVYARNASGSAVNRWAVLAITGVEVTPTSDATAGTTRQFEAMPVLTCTGITSSPTEERCVAIEPIPDGNIRRVAVAGAVQVKTADVEKITGAVVLWKNGDWALVRLGGGGIRLGEINGSWVKGTTKTVTVLKADGTPVSPEETFTAKNWFADISIDCGTRKVACARVGDSWILIAAEC